MILIYGNLLSFTCHKSTVARLSLAVFSITVSCDIPKVFTKYNCELQVFSECKHLQAPTVMTMGVKKIKINILQKNLMLLATKNDIHIIDYPIKK